MVEHESVIISLRVSSRLRDALTTEATRRRGSLNAYVLDCLNRSLEWGTLLQQFEFIHISRMGLAALLEEIDNTQITAIARKISGGLLMDLANALQGKADLDGLRRVIELTAKYQYSFPLSYSWHDDAMGSHVFIRHGISRKWSTFLGEGYLAYLEGIGLQGSYEATINSVKLTIPRKGRRT